MNLTKQQVSDLRWLKANNGATLMQFCRAMNTSPRKAAARLMWFVMNHIVEISGEQDGTYTITDRALLYI